MGMFVRAIVRSARAFVQAIFRSARATPAVWAGLILKDKRDEIETDQVQALESAYPPTEDSQPSQSSQQPGEAGHRDDQLSAMDKHY
ncbi:hypothetical protein KEM48_004583 [Puccinia striiformis f. sp. tritici PST-130]|nr:hypothetical protein H4Q26_004529 [Puccinia striiformis f. sp. tritici PST-130]KAI9611257.1 hypothetical protein KEM48_004583 [Puccinia striiformis f. sp. tritici PST-130]